MFTHSKMSRRKSMRRHKRGFFLISVAIVTVAVYALIKLTHKRSPLEVNVRFHDYYLQKQAQLTNDDDYTVVIKQPHQKELIETSSILEPLTTSSSTSTESPAAVNSGRNENWFQNPIYRCRNNPPFLLVLIASHEESGEERQIIRETWCKNKVYAKGKNVQCIFMIGRDAKDELNLTDSVVKESLSNRDIIMQTFDDNFRNSSRKMMMGLKWSEDFCPQASFVLKSEDDVIVNIKLLLENLETTKKQENFVMGRCWLSETPNRNKDSRYYVSEEMFPGAKFPPYCSTNGFVMSADVVRHMNSLHSSDDQKKIPIDDIYAGVLWKKMGIEPVNNNDFNAGKYDSKMACEYAKQAIIVHTHNHKTRRVWSALTSCGH